MAIIDEVLRLEGAAATIKSKTAALELDKASADGSGKISSSDKMDVQARAIDGIEKRTQGNQKLTASTTSVSISKGYYPSNATVSVDTMAAPTVTLSGSSQTIQSNKKFVKGNITIPAANVFRTGSDTPTSSTPGNEGDIYLVV